MIKRQSPYFRHPERLADVVAALQVMGTYKFAGRKPTDWGKSFGRLPVSADNWLTIFNEHPEFFRISDERVSLIWRRSSEKVFDTRTNKELSKEEVSVLSKEDQMLYISRTPLSAEQVTALIEIAIKLQNQVIARRAEQRWWIPVLVGALCVGFGAVIKKL